MIHALAHLPIGWIAFALLAAGGFVAFLAGRRAAESLVGALNSQPNYHGYFLAMWTVVPAAAGLLAYILFGDALARSLLVAELPSGFDAMGAAQRAQYIERAGQAAMVRGHDFPASTIFGAVAERFEVLRGSVKLAGIALATLAAGLGYWLGRRRIAAGLAARLKVEKGLQALLFLCAALAIATTIGIVVSLFFESLRFFSRVSVFDFLFGTEWNAQTNSDFGAVPLFFGTLMISFFAMCVAAPIGLLSAIYLAEYASPRTRATVKPILEVLAGIPTVVYGFFALLAVAPAVRSVALWLNGALVNLPFVDDSVFAAQPTSALAAGLVMGVMIIPFVSSLSDDVITAVPQTLRDGAYAMGATKSETIKQVVFPAALPGIIAALLLAVSRAIGETMIVVMAAGQRAQISLDPTSDLTTITVQIVALLTGDSEFDSAKTLSAFALGFVLFVVTLGFNLIALRVVQRYREKYD